MVSVTGNITSNQKLSDKLFLKEGDYVSVNRTVEMYAWKEKTETSSSVNMGGSETTETTYKYIKEWQSNPSQTADFEYIDGHENPIKSIVNLSKQTTEAAIGIYKINPNKIRLPLGETLVLSEENILLNADSQLVGGQYVYIPKSESASFDAPKIGDLRISYRVLEPGFEGTVFGKLSGDKIIRFIDNKNNDLYRLFVGSHDYAITTMHSEYTISKWLFRGIGFLMMWFGSMSLLGPISVLLDVVPMFGSLSRSLLGIVTFISSFVLSLITIMLSMLLHNIYALVLIGVLIVFGFIYFFKNTKKQKV